jgi:hypothetical protein
MKKHFFALGGVTNIKDFYKKFPTEEHFDRYVEMEYGGMYAYKAGGSTNQQNKVLQLIQMYAKVSGVDPQQIVQQLQQMKPQEKQAAVKQMLQVIKQQAAAQQSGIPAQPEVGPYMGEEAAAQYAARGGQTLHPGGDGTYYQGNFFDEGGTTYIPEYGSTAYGLPEYNLGASFQDGGSPLYSTQGQALRNFMNTVAYGRDQSMYNIEFPEVGPRRYDDGGMSPQKAAVAQQQGQQTPTQGQLQNVDPQQIMQIVVQKLQQGEEPGQILQELVQQGIPQQQAQQIIEQVMQQMQGGPENMSGSQQMMEQGAPQAMYGMGMKYGGTNKKYKVGGEYDVNESDLKKLIAQGYKIQYI